MRSLTMLGLVTFALALCSPVPVANAMNGPGYQDDRDRYRGLPPGDYVQTCRNIRVSGNYMEAECQERDGDWRRTSLDNVNRCNGIANINGNLVCGNEGEGRGDDDRDDYHRGWQNGIPPGTYIQTCRNISASGNRLNAECQNRNGRWRRTSLDDVDLCISPIANDNGNLVCPKSGGGYDYNDRSHYMGGWRGNIPFGTYIQTCRNIRARGYAVAAECQTSNGSWRNTSLFNFDQCTSAIANADGHLVCPKGAGGNVYDDHRGDDDRGRHDDDRNRHDDRDRYMGGWQGDVPAGTYIQSCRNIRVNGYAIAAECEARNGSWRNTSLFNFDQCTSPIANDDGHLVCPKN